MTGMPGYDPIIGMPIIGMEPIGMAPIGTPMVWKLGFASMPGMVSGAYAADMVVS